MKNLNGKTALLAAAATTMMFALSACQVDKTQEGEMPDVRVEGGQLPAYEVETAEVDVGTRTTEVEVPTAEVVMPDDPEHSSNQPQGETPPRP